MTSRRTTRGLVWAAFAGQVAFVASWIVAGAIEPHYDHLHDGISDLASRQAGHPWIVTAGIALLGLSLAALGFALIRVLERRPAAMSAALLFVAAGVATVLTAAFRLDCAITSDPHCRALSDAGVLSWHHYGHLWSDLAAQLLLLLTPFALARALWPGTAAAVAVVAGVEGVVIAVASFALFFDDATADGLVQRVDTFVLHVWVLIVGVGILHATRAAPARGPLIPIRPRSFLASAWTGDGELVLRPFAIGRLLAQRFEARRESTSISDRVWRIDDSAHFPGGHVERRTMYCEFTDEQHVRLTGGDLPDGAEVVLEEDGFRIPPFRMAWPIGPLPVLVRLVDRSAVAPDGTFVNSFDICTLGVRVPVARVTFRVRPAEQGTEAADASVPRSLTVS